MDKANVNSWCYPSTVIVISDKEQLVSWICGFYLEVYQIMAWVTGRGLTLHLHKAKNSWKNWCNCCKFRPRMLTSISFPVVSCHSVQCSLVTSTPLQLPVFLNQSQACAQCSLRSFNLWLGGLSLTVGDVEFWRSWKLEGRLCLCGLSNSWRIQFLKQKHYFFHHFAWKVCDVSEP